MEENTCRAAYAHAKMKIEQFTANPEFGWSRIFLQQRICLILENECAHSDHFRCERNGLF
jgi:hypothetical protein